MKQVYRFLLFMMPVFLVLSCNQGLSQADKEYIKSLEEKNRTLEKQIEELKGGSGTKDKSKKQGKGYFTIGSSEQEVLDVMGDPTSYSDMGLGGKTFNYGFSFIHFENGKI